MSDLIPVVQALALAFAGWSIGVITGPIAHIFTRWAVSPSLCVEFDSKNAGCVIETTGRLNGEAFPECTAKYARIRVRSKQTWRSWGLLPIQECRAYLIKVERAGELNAPFRDSGYADSIPLNWSYKLPEDQGPITIYNGIDYFIDVFSTWKHREDIQPEALSLPLRYSHLFDPAHREGDFRKLRLTIAVCAREMKPKTVRISVEWHGRWNDFRVECDE